jgi:dihydrofolate synthase/folylpolyglutamate synthase
VTWFRWPRAKPTTRRQPLASDRVLRRLTRPHPKTIDLSLGRIERLLAALGHPECKLPPTVLVAGTNGKGSTVAYLRAMAEAANLKVHVYTSPHLVRFHERIRVSGKLISETALDAALRECEAANAGAPITFFEITTAAAFLAFSRKPADLALIEVGLGGRLDATNVLARPRVTVITPVGLDHQHFLGNRLGLIAAEKAGILKPGVPCVVGRQSPVAARVIAERARAVGAPLIRAGLDFTVARHRGGFEYRDADGALGFSAPALPGAHQVDNAALAIAAARALRRPAIGPEAQARGLGAVDWPARLQRLGRGRLTRPLARKGFDIWLDGGHNPHAGRALGRVLESWQADDRRPVYLICGMLAVKDPKGFLRPLLPHVAAFRAVPIAADHAGLPAADLAAIARDMGLGGRAKAAPGLAEAFAEISRRRPGRVLVAGSLYLAGALLEAEGKTAWPR